MIEWILSSSALIGAVLLLRRILRGKISPVVQYALWAPVLVRLLLPVSIGETAVSVANLGQQLTQQSAVVELQETTVAQPTYEEAYQRVEQRYAAQGIVVSQLQPAERKQFEQEVAQEQQGVRLGDALPKLAVAVWTGGAVLVGGAFLWSNGRFSRRLKRDRVRLYGAESPVAVYLSDGVDTPCLFGLIRPAIYVTSQAAADPTVLRHTLVHENVHRNHGDHLWAVLRCVCLAVHWYNPLVWWGAAVSRRDGELACDQTTIRRLGEEERAGYGRTLIVMTCQKRPDLFVTATTMTTGKGGLRERILLIAKKPRMAGYTLCAVLVIAALCVGCTFTGGISGQAPDHSVPDAGSQEETEDMSEIPGATRFVIDIWDRTEQEQLGCDTAEEVFYEDATNEYYFRVIKSQYVMVAYNNSMTEDVVTALNAGRITIADLDRYGIEYFTRPKETTSEVVFERNVLYDQRVPGHLNLAVTPTQVGDYCFFVPSELNERALNSAMEKAMETATEYTTGAMRSGQFSVVLDGEWWGVNVDGSLSTAKRYIAPGDAAEVVAAAEAVLRQMGLGDPVFPEDLTGICLAALAVQDRVYTVTDEELLERIEGTLTASDRFAGGNCPYTGLLTLVLEDGSVKTIALATDGCTGWLSEGVCFDHGGDSLYELITEEIAPDTGRRIIYTAPLNENAALPVLTMEDVLVPGQDVPAVWAMYESQAVDLSTWAKIGADTLLGDYTVETLNDGSVIYHARNELTSYGALRKYIAIHEDHLSYNATWADTEHDPYYNDPAVTDEEAVALALELAGAFGLAEELEGIQPEVRWLGERSCYIYWYSNYDGMLLPGRTLQVEVIGDDAVALRLEGSNYLPVTDQQAPGYFLSYEEALYCINYARSFAREDGVFETTPYLRSVRWIWTNQFSAWDFYTTVDYTPAYAFEFVNASGSISHTVLVDVYSGLVHTQTNEGYYPSPYTFVGT